MQTKLYDLDISRTHVRNDNPYSESLFKTLKYCPSRFSSVKDAHSLAHSFARWYNIHHRHCGIRYITPDEKHR
ncbi:integrase core domain-containing protein [Escherichia coli O13,129, 135:H26]